MERDSHGDPHGEQAAISTLPACKCLEKGFPECRHVDVVLMSGHSYRVEFPELYPFRGAPEPRHKIDESPLCPTCRFGSASIFEAVYHINASIPELWEKCWALVLEKRILHPSESVVNIIGKKCSVVFVEKCYENVQTRETWGIRDNGLSRRWGGPGKGYCFGEAERLT